MALGVAGISPSGVEPRVSLLEATVTRGPVNLGPRSPTESSRNISVALQTKFFRICNIREVLAVRTSITEHAIDVDIDDRGNPPPWCTSNALTLCHELGGRWLSPLERGVTADELRRNDPVVGIANEYGCKGDAGQKCGSPLPGCLSRLTRQKHKEDRTMSEMKRRDFLKSGTMAVAGGWGRGGDADRARCDQRDRHRRSRDRLDHRRVHIRSCRQHVGAPHRARRNDLASGSMQMFFGTREVTYADPQLAARLFRAAQ